MNNGQGCVLGFSIDFYFCIYKMVCAYRCDCKFSSFQFSNIKMAAAFCKNKQTISWAFCFCISLKSHLIALEFLCVCVPFFSNKNAIRTTVWKSRRPWRRKAHSFILLLAGKEDFLRTLAFLVEVSHQIEAKKVNKNKGFSKYPFQL